MSATLKVQSIEKTTASTDGEALGVGKVKDALLVADDTNAADDMLIGGEDGQTFPLKKATPVRLGEVLNRMSFGADYDLSKIYVKAGTSGDKVQILATSFES